MSLPTIASLWIGGELSWLEQLCLKSFADRGHDVLLFAYGPVAGVPDRVRLADAAAILPSDRVIRHGRTGSPAFHADLFRLHLMAQTDYIWADTDAYCEQAFTWPLHGHLHGFTGARGASLVNNGILRLPRTSETLAALIEFTGTEYPVPPWLGAAEQEALRDEPVHVSEQGWGVWGPNALTHFLKVTGEDRFTRDQEVLYPVPFERKGYFFRPARRDMIAQMVTERTLSTHLWGRRFRAVASGYGGMPPEGSYAAELLARHAIDPAPTAHLMKSAEQKAREVWGAMPDFSALGPDDLANLCLQRSGILGSQEPVKAWLAGDRAPLADFVAAEGHALAAAAWEAQAQDFEAMRPALDANPPRRIADIGAGYGFIDLMLHRLYGAEIVLIDIEATDERHFGFSETGAGYSSLATARAFLEGNGVPPQAITTINPSRDDLAGAGKVDLAISLISCGYHYPAETYDSFWREHVATDGSLILDIRKGTRGLRYLKTLGEVSVLASGNKRAMTHVRCHA